MVWFSQPVAHNEYQLLARLQGTQAAINCLAFTKDGKFLASGDDDESVRIWDIEERRICQTINDKPLERWGQITCIKWLSGVASEQGNVISFGTGRGMILLYQRARNITLYKELLNINAFACHEPVEAMDYDQHKCRLVVCSHFGRIKMYAVEKTGALGLIWQKDFNDLLDSKGVIPRAVRFVEKGDKITIFGLESGAMVSRIAATGGENWSKTLGSSIGNACISSDEAWLLVDNLTKGFDLYKYPRSSPAEGFTVPRANAYVHDAIFLENGRFIVCGSDHGLIYLFSLETTECIQKLQHGSKSMVQVLDTCSTNRYHLIASGSSDQNAVICLWGKQRNQPTNQEQQDLQQTSWNLPNIATFFNVLCLIAVVIWAYESRFQHLTVTGVKNMIQRFANEQEVVFNPKWEDHIIPEFEEFDVPDEDFL